MNELVLQGILVHCKNMSEWPKLYIPAIAASYKAAIISSRGGGGLASSPPSPPPPKKRKRGESNERPTVLDTNEKQCHAYYANK